MSSEKSGYDPLFTASGMQELSPEAVNATSHMLLASLILNFAPPEQNSHKMPLCGLRVTSACRTF